MKEEKKNFDKEELKKTLTTLQYKVTQEKATEKPFTGQYDNFYEKGKYYCIVCKSLLFKYKVFYLGLNRSSSQDVAGLLFLLMSGNL